MKPFRCLLLLVVSVLLLPGAAFAQNKVFRSVSNDTVEKVLQGLELKYEKEERKNKNSTFLYFAFARGEQKYGLYNYGNDLWIESTFDMKMKLEDVNRWNSKAKFSRLVLIEQKDKTTVSLEAQLDALGGLTEASIRQFVNRFDEEAKAFAKFIK
jgi:hypothetical protein